MIPFMLVYFEFLQAWHKILQAEFLITMPGNEERCRFQSRKFKWREQDRVIEFEIIEPEIIERAHVIRIALATVIWHLQKTADFVSQPMALRPDEWNSFFCPQPVDLSAYKER